VTKPKDIAQANALEVMSDWEATHAGVAPILAGLDMNMPGGIAFTETAHSYFGGNLTAAVNNGSIPIERVDDMVRRIMTPYYRLGQNAATYPGIDPSSGGLNFFRRKFAFCILVDSANSSPASQYLYNWTLNPESNVDVRDDHKKLIRELGAAGIVLLKNVNNTLPLKAPKNIGVYGNDAGDLTNGLLANANYEYGVLAAGGGSGTGRLTYVVPPLDAIKRRAEQDDTLVQYVLNNTQIIASGTLFVSSTEYARV
jgi:beta-glucosidase